MCGAGHARNVSQISPEKFKDEFDFSPKINKGYSKLILSFYVFVTSHDQITQNSKAAISLQCLKKEVSDMIFACS